MPTADIKRNRFEGVLVPCQSTLWFVGAVDEEDISDYIVLYILSAFNTTAMC